MLRDITIGQYYPAESVLHRLDPRVKIIATIVYVVSLFVVNDAPGFLLGFVFLALSICLSRVPLRFMLKGMRAIFALLMITVIFNLIFTPGGETLCQFWRITITDKGVYQAVSMAFRLGFLVVGCSIMTLTTTPNMLTNGMERMMKPAGFILPVHEIAMMMSIALRFIPILMDETDKIMKAQMARGADFDTGGILKKIKGLVPLLVPLFVSAFRRANDLAMAMEARCYHGGEGRTQMKPLVYERRDGLAYLILGLYLALCIAERILF